MPRALWCTDPLHADLFKQEPRAQAACAMAKGVWHPWMVQPRRWGVPRAHPAVERVQHERHAHKVVRRVLGRGPPSAS